MRFALAARADEERTEKGCGRVLRGPGLARDVPGSHGIDQAPDRSGSASACARRRVRLGEGDEQGAGPAVSGWGEVDRARASDAGQVRAYRFARFSGLRLWGTGLQRWLAGWAAAMGRLAGPVFLYTQHQKTK